MGSQKPIEYMKIHAVNLLKQWHDSVELEYQHKDVYGVSWDSDESTEIEIKVADYDFLKEFSKKSKLKKHFLYMQGKNCPKYFYFYVLSNLTARAIKVLDYFNLPYGLIEFNSLKTKTKIIRRARSLR